MIITGVNKLRDRRYRGMQAYRVKAGSIEHIFYGRKSLKRYLNGLRKIEKRIP